ncbi:MAG: MBL fold metallo-hydrolase [bacterium]|nr:MBL fold metallo-hydrolase [bacterium]
MRNLNPSFRIDTIINGEISTNTHIISCLTDSTCMVIDPADGKVVSKFIENNNLKLKYIVNTHGHYDHISGNKFLKDKYNGLICIGAEDAEFLTNPALNMSAYVGDEFCSPKCDIILKNNDYLDLGDNRIFVRETPGHTQGSITLSLGNSFFSGDLLFMEGLGRTDLPGGDPVKLVESVRSFWSIVKMESFIYPGHGECGKKLMFENTMREIFLYRF